MLHTVPKHDCPSSPAPASLHPNYLLLTTCTYFIIYNTANTKTSTDYFCGFIWVILVIDGPPTFLNCFDYTRQHNIHDYTSRPLCITVPVFVREQPNPAKAHLSQPCQGQESVLAFAWYRALTLVKQTGLWESNVLGHGMDYQV